MTITTWSDANGAKTLSRLNLSGYVEHATIFSWMLTIAMLFTIVGLGLGLGLGMIRLSVWLVSNYAYAFVLLSIVSVTLPYSFVIAISLAATWRFRKWMSPYVPHARLHMLMWPTPLVVVVVVHFVLRYRRFSVRKDEFSEPIWSCIGTPSRTRGRVSGSESRCTNSADKTSTFFRADV